MVAKEKNWTHAKVNKMLSDRGAFEKEFNTVSIYVSRINNLTTFQLFPYSLWNTKRGNACQVTSLSAIHQPIGSITRHLRRELVRSEPKRPKRDKRLRMPTWCPICQYSADFLMEHLSKVIMGTVREAIAQGQRSGRWRSSWKTKSHSSTAGTKTLRMPY